MLFFRPPQTMSAHVTMIDDGARGIHQTLGIMRQIVRESRKHPQVRIAAVSITQLVPQKDQLGEIDALFCFCRDNIRYVSDVCETETLTAPEYTLRTRAGDCDDKVMLLAAMLESIGIATRFVVVGYRTPWDFEHVYLHAMTPDGAFVACDPTEPYALGWECAAPLAYFAERI